MIQPKAGGKKFPVFWINSLVKKPIVITLIFINDEAEVFYLLREVKHRPLILEISLVPSLVVVLVELHIIYLGRK